MDDKPEKLLEISVVAKLLNCSTRTVERMIHDHQCPLKAVRLHRRCMRVIKSSILDLMRERTI